ncbi:MAG: hypothetical protein JW900_00840 [Anaerolineae bacterium]|nr:hypothetical protein [Anaerolineae bacterium]
MRKLVLFIALGALLAATLACGGDSNGGNGGGSTTGSQLVMINNSGSTVCYVYISPTTDTTWGDDWLGMTETVSNGSRRTFDVDPGSYDLRAEDCSDNVLAEEYGVDISGTVEWTINP